MTDPTNSINVIISLSWRHFLLHYDLMINALLGASDMLHKLSELKFEVVQSEPPVALHHRSQIPQRITSRKPHDKFKPEKPKNPPKLDLPVLVFADRKIDLLLKVRTEILIWKKASEKMTQHALVCDWTLVPLWILYDAAGKLEELRGKAGVVAVQLTRIDESDLIELSSPLVRLVYKGIDAVEEMDKVVNSVLDVGWGL